MDGPSFVALVEKELKSRGIAKAEFYSATGISSATFSQWRNGLYAPSSTNIKKVEGFLGIRFDFSILLDAARDAAAKKAPAADTGDEREGYTDMELLAAYRAADERTRSAIRTLLSIPEKEGD